MEFIEEGCTEVLPLNRVFGENFQAEVPVTVLWSTEENMMRYLFFQVGEI